MLSLTIFQKRSFQAETDPAALKHVLAWFEDFKQLPLPHDVWLQCQLALIEGVTNALRHAHRGLPPETPIDIEVECIPGAIDIRIWDQGPGFDLEDVLEHKIATTDHESEGGRGLKIMYQVADILSYKPDEFRNCLHIRKCYEAA